MSIRGQNKREVGIRRIPAYTPKTPLGGVEYSPMDGYLLKKKNRRTWFRLIKILKSGASKDPIVNPNWPVAIGSYYRFIDSVVPKKLEYLISLGSSVHSVAEAVYQLTILFSFYLLCPELYGFQSKQKWSFIVYFNIMWYRLGHVWYR